MGVIYKVTNKTNNKIYIGQTIQDPQLRWNHHVEEAKLGSDTKFHRALRKYGKDNFDWEIIEEINDDQLNEREIYWISFYNSYKNGYNSTIGGDKPPRNDIEIICIETNTKYKSCKEAERFTGISSIKIAECVRHAYSRMTVGGFHWMSVDEFNEKGFVKRKSKNELSRKKIKCIETDIVYDSILEASKLTGVSRQTIRRCCDGLVKNPLSYHWEYSK